MGATFLAKKVGAEGEGGGGAGSAPPPAPTFFFLLLFIPMPSRSYFAWLEGKGNDCYAGYHVSFSLVFKKVFVPLSFVSVSER